MKYITTGVSRSDTKRRLKVMVDGEDFDFLNQFYWQVDKYNSVQTHGGHGIGRILLHRLLMNPDKEVEVDHIDGNRLNNQKSNLRFATSSQNKVNRGARKDNKSGYKGVSWHSQRKCWTARIQNPETKKYQHLGLFKTKEEAAQVYNTFASQFFGTFAWLNRV
jgi:hypothetical protein